MGIGIDSSWKVEVLRQLYMANLPNNTIITSDQEEEINVVQNTSENVQVTNVPAVTTAASSGLDRQRPVVNSAAVEGFSSLGSESSMNTCSTTDVQNVNNEALLRETTCALRSATETLSSISKIMLQQSNNTVEIDKTGYTLASAVKALNSIEDLPDLREVNTTGVNLQHQVFSHQKAVYSKDLPKMDFVAPPVKKQILEGKDVNLTILLSSKYDLPQQHTMQSGGLTVELNTKKDVRLEHNLSLEEFNRAFRKYRNIMCNAYPHRKAELEQYEADINETTHNYGPCFYTYHKMFSAKAATAITEHNILINWSKVDDKLLNLVTHNVQSRACNLCGNFDHSSKFCDRAKHGMPDAAPSTQTSNFLLGARSTDKRGRPVTAVNGQEVCNNFNYNVCFRKDCKLLHACIQCSSKTHGLKLCQSSRAGKQTNTTMPTKTDPVTYSKQPNVQSRQLNRNLHVPKSNNI
jgi:hypothetical protein